MSFTAFLFTFFLFLVGFFVALQKIFDSRAFRIALISYQEHKQEQAIEKEAQKTRHLR